MIILRNRCAIIELSSSSVKLLIGKVGNKDLDKFIYKSTRTSTTKGVIGEKMNLDWYSSHVLPAIVEYKDYCDKNNITNIVCVCTAVYRKCTNRSLIFDLINKVTDISPILLSGEEESLLVPTAYNRCCPKTNEWKLFIDQGRGSTELALQDDRENIVDLLSIPIGNDALRTTENPRKIVYLTMASSSAKKLLNFARNSKKSLSIVGSGGILTKDLGYSHLENISLDNLKNNPLLSIFHYICDILNVNKLIVNKADSTYGAWFKYFSL